ncbi:hypothetical protein NP233_g12776 [Leucocoprinus birnbaumii]|uniref:Protein kinase domain-containing protein n=1 Tax=Leucocoprinus birnbaumii TaxID=56174 RepID=A0AAD5YK43_9AGAR|nr:hypothetical protein NP233_g12776 [Leucocoprinus birnbaumii]
MYPNSFQVLGNLEASSSTAHPITTQTMTVDDLSSTYTVEESVAVMDQRDVTGCRCHRILKGGDEAVWPPSLEGTLAPGLKLYSDRHCMHTRYRGCISRCHSPSGSLGAVNGNDNNVWTHHPYVKSPQLDGCPLFPRVRRLGTALTSSRRIIISGQGLAPDSFLQQACSRTITQIAGNEELAKVLIRDLSEGARRPEAQTISDYLCKLINAREGEQGTGRNRLLRLSYKLAQETQIYPGHLVLGEIDIAPSPFAGGGYSDVYEGSHKGAKVCVKVLRVSGKDDQLKFLRVSTFISASHSESLSKASVGMYEGDHSMVVLVARKHFTAHRTVHPRLYSAEDLPCFSIDGQRQYTVFSPKPSGNFPPPSGISLVALSDMELNNPQVLDIIEGLAYLHLSRIIHGDLKSQNVLISESGRALLTDFGLSHVALMSGLHGSSGLTAVGTFNWMAPELFNERTAPTKESDIWAFGCLCYEIYTGYNPFYQYTSPGGVIAALLRDELPKRPTNSDIRVPSGLPDDDWIWNLMTSSCWSKDPKDRSSSQVIRNAVAERLGHGNISEAHSRKILCNPNVEERDSFNQLDLQEIAGILCQIVL